MMTINMNDFSGTNGGNPPEPQPSNEELFFEANMSPILGTDYAVVPKGSEHYLVPNDFSFEDFDKIEDCDYNVLRELQNRDDFDVFTEIMSDLPNEYQTVSVAKALANAWLDHDYSQYAYVGVYAHPEKKMIALLGLEVVTKGKVICLTGE